MFSNETAFTGVKLAWQKVRLGIGVSLSEAKRRNLSPEEAEELAVYPEGSVGHSFRRYRRTLGAWAEKALATRNDWWRGWKRIKPVFADVDPSTITPEMVGDGTRQSASQLVCQRRIAR
jgi:hypothetical protein